MLWSFPKPLDILKCLPYSRVRNEICPDKMLCKGHSVFWPKVHNPNLITGTIGKSYLRGILHNN